MIPIIISSVIALAITIEKIFALFHFGKLNPSLLEPLWILIRNQEWEQAQVHCKRLKEHPAAQIFLTGLQEMAKPHTDLKAVEESMKLKGDETMRQIESSVRYLGAIVTILPLLGFLGTIVGLIASFQKWEVLGANVTISDLSGGIYQAMITTAAGLILAIPYYLAHSYLVAWIDKIELELSKVSTDFLSQIRHSTLRDESRTHSKATKAAHQERIVSTEL